MSGNHCEERCLTSVDGELRPALATKSCTVMKQETIASPDETHRLKGFCPVCFSFMISYREMNSLEESVSC